MFHVISGLLALYVCRRIVWPQPWPRRLKWALCMALVLGSQHHLVTRTFFGTMASPEIPGVLLMVFGWAFGTVIFAAALLLVLDLIGLLTYAFSRRTGRAWLAAARPRAAAGALALVLSAIGVWQAVRAPDVRYVEIPLAGLPAGLDGFRIVQLTDLHASRLLQGPWMADVVARTNALSPDLTVLTGDLVDGTVQARVADVEPLRGLQARYGVYAIPGNHEYYAQYQQWLDHFDELGLRMLLNEHVVVQADQGSFILAGLTDRVAEPYGQPPPDVQAALAGVNAQDFVVLLSHRPPGAQDNARAGADLQLSGHTHGGQVWGLHWIVQVANAGYVSGQYDVDGMRLYVSHGAGLWAGFPMRLARPSEITHITLRAASPMAPAAAPT